MKALFVPLLALSSFAFAQTAVTKPAAPTTAPTAPAVTAPVTPPAPVPNTQVSVMTNMGEIIIELNNPRAPKTVENFLNYVKAAHYDGTVFHRVIKGFMIQGGGYTPLLTFKPTKPPILNEGNNGLSNLRGTVAMARMDDPHSADAQFFINTVDNKFLNYTTPDSNRGWGYTVFGKVITGMDVVDKIANAKVDNATPNFENKPVEAVIIQKVTIVPPPAPAASAPVAAPAASAAKK
jgi:cyclophilin family peptidyl-prolyl cis-trans isomerase